MMTSLPSLDTTPQVIGTERIRAAFAIEWTRADCAKLEAAGVLTRRYELLEGDIVYKMPQKTAHRVCVSSAMGWLIGWFGAKRVQSQAAIDVRPQDNPTSEPEPDVTLLHRPRTDRDPDNPLPRDIALCMEVGDSTFTYDSTTKAGLYARAEIAEYWVVGIPDRTLHVYRNPQNGSYTTHTVYRDGDTVAPLVAPESAVAVTDLLPAMASSG
ncbi:MAG: Uma2 family endonuclease [Armatimonadetes bacterium]|nr:Uma2 family endonuclease [Armatimonadota bacterium]